MPTASAAWPVEQYRRAGARSSEIDEGPADRRVLRRAAPTSPGIVLKPISETPIYAIAYTRHCTKLVITYHLFSLMND
jgi:hypothetical protein